MVSNAIAPDLFELLEPSTTGDIDFYSQYARHCGGPVLVLLCGTGRIALPIARQGVPVIGLDADPALIDLAKRKGQGSNAGRAMFVRGDPTHFVSDSKHPLVIIPGGALGRLLTLEEQRQALMAVRGALQIGGRVLLDMPIFEPTGVGAEQPIQRRIGDREAIVTEHRRFDAARQITESLIGCEWLGANGQVESKQYATIRERYSTPGELILLLQVCGFTATCYGDFDRQPLQPGATRLVIEAERT